MILKRRGFVLYVAMALALALIAAACGGDEEEPGEPDGQPDETEELQTVRIAITPYFEYQPWIIAHSLGLDAEQGLDFETIAVESSTFGVAAMRRGEFDVVSSCHACNYPIFKEVPELRNWMITNQFKGFVVVGRMGETETYEELVGTMGPEEAKQRILESFRGKGFAVFAADREPLLASMMGQIGLTLDDIEIINFADDSTAAAAFERGTGDFYMGGLPQEVNLLLGSPEKYVNVGGHEILGPAGLWYSTMASLESWIEGNHDVAMRMLAVWYRTMRYLSERPDETIPEFTRLINEAAAASFTEEEVAFIITELDHFFTLEEGQEGAFNPDSESYWKLSAEHYAEQTAEDLPEDFSVDTFMLDDAFFNDFLQEEELVEWVNAPIE